jgi:hypothetical protein
MTGRKYETKQIVTHVIVKGGHYFLCRIALLRFELCTELRVFAVEELTAAQGINGTVLGGSHEPGTRIARDARFRPLFERGNQGVLRQLLGHADIPYDAGKSGDEAGRFDSPDSVDRAVCLGSTHYYRSHHLPRDGARRLLLGRDLRA